MGTFNRPCLDCGTLTNKGNRCDPHQTAYAAKWNNRPKPPRKHYSGDYKKRARIVRENATVCWICKKGFTIEDPPTADHYYPGEPNSPLLPAHRSCNSSRGNRPPPPE
jgi:hypothetical protein